jgi:CHAT domain-containing protein
MSRERRAPIQADEADDGEPGEALVRAVFRPLAAAIGDRRRLVIAPDGDLNRLPFEVLPIAPGRRLIDQYQVSYVTVGRDLKQPPRPARETSQSPLVLADPDFDADREPCEGPRLAAAAPPVRLRSVELEAAAPRFTPLPGSRAEGERVADLLGVPARSGTEASVSCLQSCRSPRILHVATHGFFLADQDLEAERVKAMLEAQPWMDEAVLEARRAARERSMLNLLQIYGLPRAILQPDLLAELNDLRRETLAVRRIVSGAHRLTDLELENPLFRSGLALVGANASLRNPAPRDDDGLLTAEDLTGLDLRGTELVVLSACETGLGDVRSSEGVFGLRRAFALAGARTLVMSLWKVPDEPTCALMEDFSRRLLAGEGRAEALRQAQLALRARYPHPSDWGAFICQGDPSPLPPS